MHKRTLSNTRAATPAIVAIRLYQRAVSPLLPPSCRFTPTCSEYAVEALHHHGLGRGSLLALGRLLRCHPLHPGGLDPVPGTKYDKERRDGPKDSTCPFPRGDRPHRVPVRVRTEAETKRSCDPDRGDHYSTAGVAANCFSR